MHEKTVEIQSLIPDYAGQGDTDARQRSDQQARALVGETLMAMRERLPSDGSTARVDDLIERCEFGDPQVLIALEDERLNDAEIGALLEASDRDFVLAGHRLSEAEPAEVPGLIDGLAADFDRHDALILKLAGVVPRGAR
jgi:hypothetical protein